ncbi:Krr1-domain-containing protein [Boletus coccyginus]|nr:Krr1-domain-containing protein [Boletus coccyginus]
MLSDSDSDSNDLHTLTINRHFAKAFEYKKEREELAKLDEQYGSEGSSETGDSEDSEDTEEDSDGDELTPAVDAAIFCTLARIRKKDPAIYEGDRYVFEEEHVQRRDKAPVTKPKTKEKSKPLTIRDAALASALADADSRSPSPEPQPLTHTEEQVLLRSETRAAFHGAIHSETQEDDLLIPRSRTRDEIELEAEEYRAFLEQEVGEDLHNLVTVDTNEALAASEDADTVDHGEKTSEGKKKKGKKERGKQNQESDRVQDKNPMKRRDKKSEQEANQDFLMNYIFNRGWIDHSNKRVPTYNEVVESSSKRSKRRSHVDSDQNPDDDGREAPGTTISDEESFDDLADAFETSYNFRFEEPGGSLINSFPRNLSSARRESTIRKDARARKKERLEAEKHTLLEARRKEIRRARELVEAAVAEEDQDGLALAHLDLDADWDSSRHDALMADLYGGDDGIADGRDAEKPIWDDDININDIAPLTKSKSKAELKRQRKKEKKNKNVDEDVGVDVNEMDADLGAGADWGDEDDDEGEWRGTEEERKRKVDAYMDEVVNRLGFSGIVSLLGLRTVHVHFQDLQTSHMPTRFHYIPVASESYGLKPAEILLATDAELNSYVGLKKMAPYRVDRSECAILTVFVLVRIQL